MMYSRKWKNLLIILGTTAVVYVSFYYLLPLVVPFVFAFLCAKMVRPGIRWFHRITHINEKVCAVILILVILGTLGSVLFYVGFLCADQLGKMMRNMPAHLEVCGRLCKNACGGVDNLLGMAPGRTYVWMEQCVAGMGGKISETYLPRLSGMIPGMLLTIGEWGAAFVVFVMSTLLISFDKEPEVRYRSLMPILHRLKITGFAYLKSQFIIIVIVATVSVVALLILRNPYAILFGIAIGLIDAFPILGSGSVLIPWGIVEIVQGDIFPAAVLFTLYVVTMLLREVLEPRLMGKELGLKPLYILMSVYVGVKLFGVAGIILGPIGLTILKAVMETQLVHP